MLQSRLCLGRWRLLPTIRAGGRGSPRALPPTPQVRRGAGSGATDGKFASGNFGESESRAVPCELLLTPTGGGRGETCPGAAGEPGQERPARGASPGSTAL